MTDDRGRLIAPHGGKLIDLLASPERTSQLRFASAEWPSWELDPRQLCDLELIANGAFSPLTRFLGRSDYETVCGAMRLASGALWPIPVTLDVTDEFRRSIGPGSSVALRASERT